MRWSGNNLWRGVIPASVPACATVAYFVRALDVSGNTVESPVKTFVVAGSCGVPGDFDGNGTVEAPTSRRCSTTGALVASPISTAMAPPTPRICRSC
jgi:hypothetical protein